MLAAPLNPHGFACGRRVPEAPDEGITPHAGSGRLHLAEQMVTSNLSCGNRSINDLSGRTGQRKQTLPLGATGSAGIREAVAEKYLLTGGAGQYRQALREKGSMRGRCVGSPAPRRRPQRMARLLPGHSDNRLPLRRDGHVGTVTFALEY